MIYDESILLNLDDVFEQKTLIYYQASLHAKWININKNWI